MQDGFFFLPAEFFQGLQKKDERLTLDPSDQRFPLELDFEKENPAVIRVGDSSEKSFFLKTVHQIGDGRLGDAQLGACFRHRDRSGGGKLAQEGKLGKVQSRTH